MPSSRQNFETIQLGNKRWIFTYLFFFVLGMTFQAQMGLLSFYNSCYEQSDSSNGLSEAMDLPRKPEKENVEIAQTKSIRKNKNVTHHKAHIIPIPKNNATSRQEKVTIDDVSKDSEKENNETHKVSGAVIDFERQDGVVIATKIGQKQKFKELIQSQCLLHAAYNHKVLYDIVVFTSFEILKEDVDKLQQIVAPAKVSVVMDSKPLQEELHALSQIQKEKLLNRCNLTELSKITWDTRCAEPDGKWVQGDINYNWQAEFRSKQIWTSPVLKPYKWMLWFDTDAMPTKVWDRDPIAMMVRNNLAIFFDNFPQGTTRTKMIHERIFDSFGVDVCHTFLDQDGQLRSVTKSKVCTNHGGMSQIHGFFHITNLDFYRR